MPHLLLFLALGAAPWLLALVAVVAAVGVGVLGRHVSALGLAAAVAAWARGHGAVCLLGVASAGLAKVAAGAWAAGAD